ncbi:MAG: pyrophosphohydrolase [Firmicutes bacterium]|nr:pyrophosphohydrolase [Bacillota bacterium]
MNMPIKISAGLLMYRFRNSTLELLLGHPGGPLYIEKDDGYWGIPKGEREGEEHLRDTAIREFCEETGLLPEIEDVIPLGSIMDNTEKLICIWAFQGNCDAGEEINSNLFELEWPEGSGCVQLFPELDAIKFFSVQDAITKIEPDQREFVLRLERFLELRMAVSQLETYQVAI